MQCPRANREARGHELHAKLYALLLFSAMISLIPPVDATDAVIEYQTVADFATNLFTDLAPLVALFGQDVSKQFLSQSIDWWDDILFAMAPVGILTIVLGAIRVGGHGWLRNIIGRAREPPSVSEAEFLSSTSDDVSEVWNKRGVVRKVDCNGSIKQILYDDTPGIQTVMSMWEAEFSREPQEQPYITRRDKNQNPLTLPEDPEIRRNWNLMPPNLTLNAHKPIDNRYPIATSAVAGIILQAGVIAFQAVVNYHLKWTMTENLVEGYAFPLASTGTCMVCLGVLICARAIESCTTEVIWIPAERTKDEKKNLKVMWVQRGSQEAFASYAIFRVDAKDQMPGDFRPIWGSYQTQNPRDINWLNYFVLLGSLLCLIGFPVQFIGLRGLHYSATLAQLVATGVMILIRSVVRNGLSKNPPILPLQKGYELDKVALLIAGLNSCRPGPRFLYWKEIDGIKL